MRLLPAVFAIATASLAQTTSAPLVVDAATAQQHIRIQYAPIYPPIAVAAHVSGEVTLQGTVDTEGRIVSLKAVSGPDMLKGAALDVVRNWEYTPFESEGHPVPAVITVVVPFPFKAPKGVKLLNPVEPDIRECRQALADKQHPEKAVKPCEHAADVAEKNPTELRFRLGETAFEYVAAAEMQSGHPAEALPYLDKLVSWIGEPHTRDFADISNIYATRAQARAAAGNVVGAEQDVAIAEDMMRKALANAVADRNALLKAPSLPAGTNYIDYQISYTARLKETLKLHATLLSALGKKDEAQAKLDEAAKLN